MSWSTVQASIEFYNGSQSWGTSSPIPVTALSSTEQSSVLDYLYYLYTNSTTAATVIDEAVLNGPIRIAESPIGISGFADMARGFVAVNLTTISNFYYVNDHGKLVNDVAALTVMHEMYHLAYSITDPLTTNTYLNTATAIHQGPAVSTTNLVAEELGLMDNIRSSYSAAADTLDPRFSALTPDKDYTNGHTIDIARFGSNSSDTLDHSSRTTELRDLFFGFDGDDVIYGGVGDDYAYGGAGEDTIYGGGDDDVLYGEGDDDVLYGGDGNDVIVDGTGGDTIDGGAGLDVLSLLSATSGQTVGVSVASVSIAGGGTVTSIESVLGSTHVDTFNIDPDGDVAGLYATLGGDDVINIDVSTTYQPLYIAPGDGADTLNVVGSWEYSAPDLLLIGGDSTDEIQLNGLSPQDIFAMSNDFDNADPGVYIRYTHQRGYTDPNGDPALVMDSWISAWADESVPGWIRYEMSYCPVTLVPLGDGYQWVNDEANFSYLAVEVFGFESGDYGLPDLLAAPDMISNSILRLQLDAVTDVGDEFWHRPDEAARAAFASSAVWDSLFI